MSEKIITARRTLICDICGLPIPRGSQCRIIRDDFQRRLFCFEHLRCPGNPAGTVKSGMPQPSKNICQHYAPCLA